MQHRRATDRRSIARALGALLVAVGVAGTTLAAAGSSTRPSTAADVVQIARQQLGDAYTWGGDGPNNWDCSGLTSYMWREIGGVEDVPRISRDQHAWAVPIPREQLLLGDLVFFGNPVTHVALYSGNGMMVDASSSQGKVVERRIWTSGVVRFGRVPRHGMAPVKPWTPPPLPPVPTAAPITAQAAPGAAPRVTAPLVPLRGLPAPNLGPSTAVAVRAIANARTVVGSRRWTDLDLVRVAWHHARGGTLPATFPQIEASGKAVPKESVRIGDLVVYGRPATHMGYYLGHGYMVDASPSLGKVVVRRVFVSPTVRFLRLTPRG